MANNFSDLRKQSKEIEKVQKNLQAQGGKKNYDDDRFWQAALDKAKNGRAIGRFLPPPKGEDQHEVLLYTHFFQGPGGYYVENCPTTIGLPCPACEDNGVHWKEGGEEGKKFVRERKSSRQQNYIANFLVRQDFATPENNGRVTLFKYGPQLHKIYADAITPEIAGMEAYLPYDFWEGADFELLITQKKTGDKSYANFERSRFLPRQALQLSDDELQKVWEKEFSLKQFIAPSEFKPYEELKAKLDKVLGDTAAAGGSSAPGKSLEDDLKALSSQKLKTLSAPKSESVTPNPDDEKEEDDSQISVDTSQLETISQSTSVDSQDTIESIRNLIK